MLDVKLMKFKYLVTLMQSVTDLGSAELQGHDYPIQISGQCRLLWRRSSSRFPRSICVDEELDK